MNSAVNLVLTCYMFQGPSRMCFSKPVIGAIDGYAVAGGLELSLLCDMRVIEESAVMGVFCRRFGKLVLHLSVLTSKVMEQLQSFITLINWIYSSFFFLQKRNFRMRLKNEHFHMHVESC